MNSLYNVLGRVLTGLIQAISIPLLYRSLGPYDYGLYATVLIVYSSIQILDLGVGKSVIRLMSLEGENSEAIFYSLMVLLLGVITFSTIVLSLISQVGVFQTDMADIYLMSVAWGLMEMLRMLLIGKALFLNKFLVFNILNVSVESCKLLIIYLMDELTLSSFVGFLILLTAGQIFFYGKVTSISIGRIFRNLDSAYTLLRKYRKSLIDMTLSNLVLKSNILIDKIIVWSIGGPELIANYYFAIQIFSKTSEIPHQIMIGYNPEIAKTFNNGHLRKMRSSVFKSILFSIVFIFLSIFSFYIIGEMLLMTVLQTSDEKIFVFTRLVLLALPFAVIINQVQNIMTMAGKISNITRIQLLFFMVFSVIILFNFNGLNELDILVTFILSHFLVGVYSVWILKKWDKEVFRIMNMVVLLSFSICVVLYLSML